MKIWLRNLFYLGCLATFFPWLAWRRWKTGKYRHGWHEKLWGYNSTPPQSQDATTDSTDLIWLHGVSVGEVQLLAPLVRRLLHSRPNCRIAISTTTQTGMELAERLFVEFGDAVEHLFYMPFDFSWAIRRTLQALRPSAIILGELEVWPNLISLADQAGVPVAVVNGRLSERSFAGYRRFAFLTTAMFSKLSLVASQSETYSQRFIACGVPSECVVTTGSYKFDNVTFDRRATEVERLRQLIGINEANRIWVCGSSQQPEEIASCEALKRLRTEFPSLKLIVIPRHKERFDEAFAELNKRGLRVIRRSNVATPVSQEHWDVLIVDSIGELRWWWGLAELALVGGSFCNRNGQNMIEPAAYGASVAFGPKTKNFRDIVDLLLDADAAEVIPSVDDIYDWAASQLHNPEAGRVRGRAAQELVRQQQGALDKTLVAIQSLLDRSRIKAHAIMADSISPESAKSSAA